MVRDFRTAGIDCWNTKNMLAQKGIGSLDRHENAKDQIMLHDGLCLDWHAIAFGCCPRRSRKKTAARTAGNFRSKGLFVGVLNIWLKKELGH
jgi:hypothetical protein